jgi:hypothetical protein
MIKFKISKPIEIKLGKHSTNPILNFIPKKDFYIDKENIDFCLFRERTIEHNILNEFKLQHNIDLTNIKPNEPFFERFIKPNEKSINAINNFKQDENILNWFKEDLKHLTKRNIFSVNTGSFIQNHNLFFQNKQKLFIKSINKNFSSIINKNDLSDIFWYGERTNFLNNIIISDIVNFKREFRIFVVNHKLNSISENLDYKITNIPKEITKLAIQTINHLKNNFSPHYALDIGTTDKEPAIIEFNPISNSGRYLQNNFINLVSELTKLNIDKPYLDFVNEFDNKYLKG